MRIPIYQPTLKGNEKKYVQDCLDTSWISSKGKYVEEFESLFAKYVGSNAAVSVCNGTVAIHLALAALGIGVGDEVIVPTLTYIASANPIKYLGATPVFVDSENDSWQISPADVINKITANTKAIVVAHLYGHPVDMYSIMRIAEEHNLWVLEDCAEAFGSRINDIHVGNFGHVSTYSFYGNKTITTGEGGMVVTNNYDLQDRLLRLRGQGLAKDRIYWHDLIGFNYRMTNICAAIGVAQLEYADETILSKVSLAKNYDKLFLGSNVVTHSVVSDIYYHTYWMYSIRVPQGMRDALMLFLDEKGIETRPVFYPIHSMPPYSVDNGQYPNANLISASGMNLPSWPGLTYSQQAYIVDCVLLGIKALS